MNHTALLEWQHVVLFEPGHAQNVSAFVPTYTISLSLAQLLIGLRILWSHFSDYRILSLFWKRAKLSNNLSNRGDRGK